LKALESGQAVDVIADRIAQKKKERDTLEQQYLLETVQHPVPEMSEIRFFLSQFKKGDINDPKYRQGLIDMLVNKIYLYDGKMTVLCNTQNGHFDVDLDETSSSNGRLVEARGIEPLSENSFMQTSPGASFLLTFPLPDAEKKAAGFSSFIGHAVGKAYHGHVHR
jgi:site-specific DNA recombinase